MTRQLDEPEIAILISVVRSAIQGRPLRPTRYPAVRLPEWQTATGPIAGGTLDAWPPFWDRLIDEGWVEQNDFLNGILPTEKTIEAFDGFEVTLALAKAKGLLGDEEDHG